SASKAAGYVDHILDSAALAFGLWEAGRAIAPQLHRWAVARAASRGTRTSQVLGVYGPGEEEVLQVANVRNDRVIQSLSELRPGEKLTIIGHGNARLIRIGPRGPDNPPYTTDQFADLLRAHGVAPSEIELLGCNLARQPRGGGM